MDSKVTLHRATKDHANGISAVIRDAIKRINARDYPPSEVDRLMLNFTPDMVLGLLGERQTLVALSQGAVIGTGALQGTEVKSVFVSPEWNRNGVGTALMKALEELAVQQGHTVLNVSSSLSATGFYGALGYVAHARQLYGLEETVLMSKAVSTSQID